VDRKFPLAVLLFLRHAANATAAQFDFVNDGNVPAADNKLARLAFQIWFRGVTHFLQRAPARFRRLGFALVRARMQSLWI